jgi:hypothetical protein
MVEAERHVGDQVSVERRYYLGSLTSEPTVTSDGSPACETLTAPIATTVSKAILAIMVLSEDCRRDCKATR